MPTLRQLSLNSRVLKRRRCPVAALAGGPQRKGVVMKMGITTPRKPNSAKRKYAKVRVMYSKKLIHAHVPGVGPTYIQEYSIVLVEGGNPPDTPGVNYSLVRGVYDFFKSEEYGRKKRRSKFGAMKPRPYKKKRY
jgi:small subunit ribosomal protein S12